MIDVECIKTRYYEHWYIKGTGMLHREDGPAVVIYYKNGNKQNEAWLQNGKVHRIDGPAEICYDENGNIKYESWCKNGKRHCDDDPVEIWYDINGNKYYELWRKNNKIHREDGPAVIEYYENGRIKGWEYFINHNDITEWAKDNITDPFNPTDEEKAVMLLTWG